MRRAAAAAVLALALTASGCAFDPSSVPVPGATVAGAKYPLRLQFANVLNLPTRAKVLVDGLEAGELESTRIVPARAGQPGYVDLTVRVAAWVRLPVDTKAELRQATPLGDTHIALIPPLPRHGPFLAPDAVIPLSAAGRATQIEDTLAGLATAIGNGTITDLQDTVRQLNAVLPEDPAETARIFGVIADELIAVGADLEAVDMVLDGLQATADTVLADGPMLDQLLTDSGVRHEVAVVQTLVEVLFIFTELGPLSHRLTWLAPLVQSLDATAAALVPMVLGTSPLDLSAPSNLRALVDLLQHDLVPFVRSGPKVSVDSVTVAGAAAAPATEQTARIVDTLRMIGVVR